MPDLVDKSVVLRVKKCYTRRCHVMGAAMYKLVRQLGLKQLAIEEAAPLALALVIAELFYKFHSFTLEAAAFLATWYAISAVASWVRTRVRAPDPSPEDVR